MVIENIAMSAPTKSVVWAGVEPGNISEVLWTIFNIGFQTDPPYLPADHSKNLYEFMCDVNLWSAGKSQKQLTKILKLLQTLCDSVQSLHESQVKNLSKS